MTNSGREKYKRQWLLKPYTMPIIVLVILILILTIVLVCYKKINKQFCEERLRSLEAVSSKITLSIYTRFDVQWTSLSYSIKILQTLEDTSENSIFYELESIEDSLGFTEGDGMLYLFDDKGYYYGSKGKIGLWNEQVILQKEQASSVYVTNLPKQATHLGDFMMFFCRLPEPRTMDGITITHVALARDISILDNDLEIGNYGDLDSSYIIQKNGTRIYHQSNNEVFTNVYNVLKALDGCRFEHHETKEGVTQAIQQNKSGSVHMIYEGVDYIMAYQPLDIDDWYAVYIVSLNSMSLSTREFILQTVWIIGGTGVILLLLCLLLVNINNYRWHLRQSAVNKKLCEAVEQAKRASSAKSDFLSRMSHDIRTPLNGIIGMTKIARENMDHVEKLNDCFDKINTCSDHLISLINDVLDMSRIESGNVEMRSMSFSLQRVLKECGDIIEGRAHERGIIFHCDYSGIVHDAVQGDEHRLKQILINILGNAIKFTPDGGEISLCATEEDQQNSPALFRIVVKDNGIGMSADYLEHVFEPFSQEDNGPRTSYQGTGLGMSIVKKLVEQMNGEIRVQSQKNKGSRFILLLPLYAEQPNELKTDEKYNYAVYPGVHDKILLVEDSALNREIAEFLLKEAGLYVVSAENGKQAVDIFCSSEPGEFDAILMDIMMPVMDGLEAARIIREQDRPDAKTIPIIAMTANAYQEDKEKSLKAGMNAHLVKPLKSEALLHVLEKCRKERENDEKNT